MRAVEVFSLESSGLADDDLRHTGFVNVRTHEEPMALSCIWEWSMNESGGLILVAGATGYVGGRLVQALEQAGRRVWCLARRPAFLSTRDSGACVAC